MKRLKRLSLKGFKSIRDLSIDLLPLNVLIGANGAGKSNLVSFFKMLNEMMGGRLQQFVATSGRAQSLLYFGPKTTPQIEATLEFQTDNGIDTYHVRLFHAAGDTLVFAEEKLTYLAEDWVGEPRVTNLRAGHEETRINDEAYQGDANAKALRFLLNRCRVFHFHDTSATARIRQYCYAGDDKWLMPDAGNLAAILLRLRDRTGGPSYRRILATIRQIAPFFEDFELELTGNGNKEVILNWRQRNSPQTFGPHQLSDGTLRAMALITLLLQPVENLPDVLVIDEPELGLHPSAKTIIAGLLKKASHHCQIIVATQSSELLDSFDPQDVIVVERDEKESKFKRLEEPVLHDWLSEYSLGQLWEKNVIGGGPFE